MPSSRYSLSYRTIPLYIPNILGYVRIILAFIGMYYSCYQQSTYAIILWIVACILDLFDGIIARYLHQTSQFGVLLDIIADNILRTTIWICVCNTSYLHYILQDHNTTNITPTLITTNTFITSHPILIIVFSSCIICIEWITMICTQLHHHHQQNNYNNNNNNNNNSHWKESSVHRNDQNCSSTSTSTNDHHQASKSSQWLLTTFFHNNFRNPLGIWGIYGLFSMNLWIYGCFCDHPMIGSNNNNHNNVYHTINQYSNMLFALVLPTPDQYYYSLNLYDICLYLAIIGRFLSLYIELHLCYNYLSFIITKEQEEKTNMRTTAYNIKHQ